MPPVNDDEVTEIQFQCALQAWREHALGQHAVRDLPALLLR